MATVEAVGGAMVEVVDGAMVEVVGGDMVVVDGALDTETGGGAQVVAVAGAVDLVDRLEDHEPPQVTTYSMQ